LQPRSCDANQLLDRDLRLDACRGIALWFVYLDHIPDNVCSWFTLNHYGFSDTTEIFMFVSGVTCAKMPAKKHTPIAASGERICDI